MFCCEKGVRVNSHKFSGYISADHCSECHKKADNIREKRGLNTVAWVEEEDTDNSVFEQSI